MKERTERAKRLRKQIADRFGELRIDSGLTQTEMAEAMGVTQNIIFRSEHDMSVSTVTLLTMFLYYSDTKMVNPMWLFSLDNSDYRRYLTTKDLKKSNRDILDAKRKQIMEDMVKSLREAGLMED